MVAAALALVTVIALTPLFKDLPEAVLAALIIHAVSHLWKVGEFRRYRTLAPAEFWLGLLTLVGVITLDVLPGLLIGVIAMLLLVIYQASRPHVARLGADPGAPGAYGDVERHADYRRPAGLEILRLDAPLFYANATLVRDRVKSVVGAAEPMPHAVILEIGANARLDITSIEMLRDLAATLRSAGVDLALAEVHRRVVEVLATAGLLDRLGEDRVFHTLDEAVQALRDAPRPSIDPEPVAVR